MKQALVVHVPVRQARLRFEPAAMVVASPEAADELIDAIDAELALLRDVPRPTTIRIDGGAPTCLPPALLGRLLDAIATHVSRVRTKEITVAVSPRSVSAEKAEILRAGGANRASLQIYSFDPLALRTLGCLHDAELAAAARHLLRAAGFENVSVELACGVPGGDEGFLASVERAIELEPEHVVIRPLRPHPESTLARWLDEARLPRPGRSAAAARFGGAVERLAAAGYEHYAAHAFARDGRRSVERVEAWSGRPRLGVGPGARSESGPTVRTNTADPDLYVRRMLHTGRADRRERRSAAAAAAADVRRGLDAVSGVTLGPIARRWGVDAEERLRPALEREIRRGTIESRRRRLRLTPQGWPLADDVLAALS